MDLLMVAGTNRNSILGYIIAIAMVGLAFLLRLSVGDILADAHVAFIPPVLIAAFFGGLGPAFLAMTLSIFVVQYAFTGTGPFLLPMGLNAWVDLLCYIAGALVIIGLIQVLMTVLTERNRLRASLTEFNARLDVMVEERIDQVKLDMREQATAESQRFQIQKMETIGQLTGGVAHDFNNMLAVIVGSLDIAERRLEKGQLEQTRQCIGNAREGARRAANLTTRLLAFSRQQPLSPAVLDLNAVLSGMKDSLHETAGRDIKVEIVETAGLWPAFADPAQLEHAIGNLVSNARDAMPEGGTLTIETGNAELDARYARSHPEVRPGQYGVIMVEDTGSGMAADVLDRAFDPFYSTKGPRIGIGLGLSQVYGYVKQSGGHIRIHSEIGSGTTVKLYLPRYQGEAVFPIPRPEKPTGLPKAARHEIVLVVEDEDNVRHMMVEALRELGYSVIEASGGKDALQQLQLYVHIDLLFTDVVMPEMNGKMVADAVKDRFPGVKVVYTTGFTRNTIVHNGIIEPGVNLLTKPFTLEQLALKLSETLKRD